MRNLWLPTAFTSQLRNEKAQLHEILQRCEGQQEKAGEGNSAAEVDDIAPKLPGRCYHRARKISSLGFRSFPAILFSGHLIWMLHSINPLIPYARKLHPRAKDQNPQPCWYPVLIHLHPKKAGNKEMNAAQTRRHGGNICLNWLLSCLELPSPISTGTSSLSHCHERTTSDNPETT